MKTRVQMLEMAMECLELGNKLSLFATECDASDETAYPETTAALKTMLIGLIQLAEAQDLVEMDEADFEEYSIRRMKGQSN
jgi:hypothetical protein